MIPILVGKERKGRGNTTVDLNVGTEEKEKVVQLFSLPSFLSLPPRIRSGLILFFFHFPIALRKIVRCTYIVTQFSVSVCV